MSIVIPRLERNQAAATPKGENAVNSGRSSFREQLRELYRHRDLLVLWTLRDVKVRYKQSLLGVAWAILQPLSIMLIFTLIFSMIARMPSDGLPYPLFSYVALLPWTMLATALTTAVPSLTTNMNLVSKVYFPREILPIAAVLASVVDFLVASVIFVVLMLLYGVSVGPAIVALPLLVLVQLALMLGLTMWASALNVFYRDIRFVVPLATQLWMYVTPVIYPVSLVPERFRPLYMLNPMATVVEGYRRALLLDQPPDLGSLGLAAVVSLVALWSGYRYFKRAELQFADVI
jgi:lipopolysaccharide transport system permease protein